MKKIVFIHLPKCGGTLLNKYSSTEPQFEYWMYKDQAHKPATTVVKNNDIYLFGLVRNPWDWYVSRYFYFIKKDVKENGISKRSASGS